MRVALTGQHAKVIAVIWAASVGLPRIDGTCDDFPDWARILAIASPIEAIPLAG